MADTSKNSYTIIFLAVTTVVAALILSIASEKLKVQQNINKKFDQKKIVMKAMGFDIKPSATPADVDALYNSSVERIFVNPLGEKVEGVDGEKYNFEKAMKEGGLHAKAPADYNALSEKAKAVAMPVFIRKDKDGKPLNYTFPVIGKGLWSTLYGYISLSAQDLNTIEGAIFYNTGETPGLGKEIEAQWFCKNFIGKKIFDENGSLTSITINKGPVNPADHDVIHKVDGVSGATITGNGVTALLSKDLRLYLPYITSLRGGSN